MVREDPLAALTLADPGVSASVSAALKRKAIPISRADLFRMVTEIIWGLTLETSFGEAIAEGYMRLVGEVPNFVVAEYRRSVRKAGEEGPTLGRLIARHLPPVLEVLDPDLTDRFHTAARILLKKGMHLLHEPFEEVYRLLSAGDPVAGRRFLDLLISVFSTELTFNRARALSHLLPTAVSHFSLANRGMLIREVCRVSAVSSDLVDPFLDGIENGLDLLTGDALQGFVDAGLRKYNRNKDLGKAFLSLESQVSRQCFDDLQVNVPLSQVRDSLNRYLRARTGTALTVKPISELSEGLLDGDELPRVLCDGRFVYLPDAINAFPVKNRNLSLYKSLAGMESGYQEINSDEFDMEKLMALCPQWAPVSPPMPELSDLENFFCSFPNPVLARDLFSLFEGGRFRVLIGGRYPGLFRQVRPILEDEILRILKIPGITESVFIFLVTVFLGPEASLRYRMDSSASEHLAIISASADTFLRDNPTPETSARLVIQFYPDFHGTIESLPMPFGRRVRPDLVRRTFSEEERLSSIIKAALAEKRLKVYRSEVRRHLISNHGILSASDLAMMLRTDSDGKGEQVATITPGIRAGLTEILSEVFGNTGVDMPENAENGSVFWYPEWDIRVADYRNDHARVVEKEIHGRDEAVYWDALNHNSMLVKKIRYAFELLKPEALSILRGWLEGDEFDYRALIEAGIDHQMGRIPSERLYIKRIKKQRDVAVLLLVDLSRSTANMVPGTRKTILDVEREAIVLFCEALEVVGDAFAVSGFSGTGRLSVDYWNIKTFNEPMGDVVRARIGAMAPQRSTRMGAAIRHGLSQLEKIPKKVRLLITLGDGFPNDTGYKGEYAVSDTRRAFLEARSKGIHLRPITVNLAPDRQLDEMYGCLHHTVISDVRELPDKLWRIYSSMTR